MRSNIDVNRRDFLSVSGFAILGLSACSDPLSPLAAAPHKSVAPKALILIKAARAQIGVTTAYDPAYTVLSFPDGDVPRAKGVCTDVVIRAYRDALNLDLQQWVHTDMKANFAVYPKTWGLEAADTNIDHRRVLNLESFLKRQGASLPLSQNPHDWRPGDIITSRVGGKLPHIGIVSEQRAGSRPLIIHNIGRGTQEEDVLFAHKIVGHFRWKLS